MEQLAALRESGNFDEEQWQFLSDPTLFGHMVLAYRGQSGITVFEGECYGPNAFEVVRSQSDSVTIRYFDEFFEEERTTTLTVDGDRLYVPIASLKGQHREVFLRVPVAEVVQRHSCTKQFLAGLNDAA